MSNAKIVVASLLLAFAGQAAAHAKVVATQPADGDFVSAPAQLGIEFDNPVTLTGVTLHTVDGESGELALPTEEPGQAFSINMPDTLAPGEYFVVWKAIAADSHFATGEFFFTVVAD